MTDFDGPNVAPKKDLLSHASGSGSAEVPGYVALNLERFKVTEINCDGWIVVPEVERALKELFEKHNALVDYLSTAT